MVLASCPPCGLVELNGRTLLMAAIDDGNLEVAYAILDSKPPSEYLERVNGGSTVLSVATERGYHVIVQRVAPRVSQGTRTAAVAVALAVQDPVAATILREHGV
jgi:hypothetical protein